MCSIREVTFFVYAVRSMFPLFCCLKECVSPMSACPFLVGPSSHFLVVKPQRVTPQDWIEQQPIFSTITYFNHPFNILFNLFHCLKCYLRKNAPHFALLCENDLVPPVVSGIVLPMLILLIAISLDGKQGADHRITIKYCTQK